MTSLVLEPDMQALPSVCPLDCPDTCSLTAIVEDDRLVAVRGSDSNPYTDSAICSKVARGYPEFVHGQQRLSKPLKRTGKRGSGEFAQVSWEEALDLVYDGFSKRNQPIRTAVGPAIELCRPAWRTCRRFYGSSFFSQAGRFASESRPLVRRSSGDRLQQSFWRCTRDDA